MKRRILGVLAAAAAMSAIGMPAFAQDAAGTDQMRVKVGDLNLAAGTGARSALNRIRVATRDFCSVSPGDRNLAVQAEARKCDAQMTYLAVKKLDSPVVTAMYEGSHSTQPPVLLAQR
jgi:UrcA family protein